MTFSRRFRSLACRLMAVVLLLSQCAVAAYACPQGATGVPAAPVASMAHCADMHPTADALCAAHCHPATPSADTSPAPAAPVMATAVMLYVLPDDAASMAREALPGGPAAPEGEGDIPEPPSHAVLHCVWRI